MLFTFEDFHSPSRSVEPDDASFLELNFKPNNAWLIQLTTNDTDVSKHSTEKRYHASTALNRLKI